MGRLTKTGWKCDYCGRETTVEEPSEWLTLLLSDLDPEWIEHAPDSDTSTMCHKCVKLLRAFLKTLGDVPRNVQEEGQC